MNRVLIQQELPPSIRIGWKVYRVENWDPLDAAKAQKYGECDHTNCLIRVDTSHGLAQSVETLLHEVLHAAWYLGGLQELDNPSEEATVTILANQLTQVLLDNPLFGQFLATLGKETR